MADQSEFPEQSQPQGQPGATAPAPADGHADEAVESAGEGAEPVALEMETELLPYPVVAIGASAGGLEAVLDLLRTLPSNTGMSFVLISHLAPDQKSHLVEILGSHTSMAVSAVAHGLRPEPNHIYILEPNLYVWFSRGRFELEPRPEGVRVPMPIDHFFRALAADQSTRAIGVILSGADSDGALGLKAIKGEGGIAIVQAPESARHQGMPRSSIAADHVDLILTPPEIGHELARIGRQFQRPEVRRIEEVIPQPATEEQHLTRILTQLSSVAGIKFRQYKPATLQRRIARRMVLNRVNTLQDYARFLQLHPGELRDLHEDVLINVTRFFRDPEVWETLKRDILPLIYEQRPVEQQLRVWVPGCSTGEEVYTAAIYVLEFLQSIGEEQAPVQIFGTDASERLVQAARVGSYQESIVQDVSPERLRRFFIKSDKHYQVTKRVRDMCIFARQNLCGDPPFSRLDLVSCRNVLIYFGGLLQKQVVPTFHYALRPNGVLLLGTSESLREYGDLFRMIDRKHKFYLKVASATPINIDFPRPISIPDTHEVVGFELARQPWTDTDLQRAADRIVLARFGPAGVVIDDRMDIQQSRGHTAPYLEMSPGSPNLNLMRMVRDSIGTEVRSVVQRAIESDMPVQARDLEVREGGQRHKVTVEVLPIQGPPFRGRSFLVLFIPQADIEVSRRPETEPAPAIPEDQRDRLLAELRQERDTAKLHLQALMEEWDIKNQDLVSANEEVQSANEELQSANEELETTKEEVQSANEELQTVNEELQQRNAKLIEATNDLTNLLHSVNIPVLMLASNLEIRQFTPPIQKLFNLRTADVGRPISDIRHNLTIDDFQPIVQNVLETLSTRELEVRDKEGHWYLMRVRPYRTAENKIDGAVIVLLDIDQVRRAQEELRAARDYANAIVERVELPVVVLRADLTVRTANSAFRAIVNLGPEDMERRSLPDILALHFGIGQIRDRLEGLKGSAGHFDVEYETTGAERRVFRFYGQNVRVDGEGVILLTMEDYTVRRSAERLLASERQNLEGQMESTTQELGRTQDELRGLAASLFRSQEDERRWVARELHDDISQKLAFLDMEFQQFADQLKHDPSGAEAHIESLRKRAASLSEEVRRISHRLHPSILDDLGLTHALRALVEEFSERENMLATFSSRNVPEEVSREVASGFYRIAQEALRNVAKHAGKTHVKVSLEGVDQRLCLRVSDHGEGFDPDGAQRGLGLITMSERARLIQGTLQIQSALGEGTTVTLDAPLPPPRVNNPKI